MNDGDEVYYIRCLYIKKKERCVKEEDSNPHHITAYKRHSSLLKVKMKRVI
jgi:hypothetical protein